MQHMYIYTKEQKIMKKFSRRIWLVITAVLAGALLWGCGSDDNAVEFKPEDRFVYFTGLTGEQKLEIELPAGKQVFTVTMDNGDLFTRIENDTVVLMDEQTTFTDDFILNAPKAGTYILTFTGEDASGSFNYGDPDVASCPGATVVEPVRK